MILCQLEINFTSFKRIVIGKYNAVSETLAQRYRLFLMELQNLEELNLVTGGASRSELGLKNVESKEVKIHVWTKLVFVF